MTDFEKHITDASSVLVLLGALLQWLPSIAALFTIIWTIIRIFETNTFQWLCGQCAEKLKRKSNG